MRDDMGIPRPFSASHEFREPAPERYAEILGGMLEEFDTELPDRLGAGGPHEHDLGSMFRDLDEFMIALDLVAAFDSHGYQELKRPAYYGEEWLKAKLWFPKEEIQNDPEESRHSPGDVEPNHVEVLRLEDADAIHGTDNTPSGQWRAVRRVPAAVLGPISAGGVGR